MLLSSNENNLHYLQNVTEVVNFPGIMVINPSQPKQ